MTAATKKKRLVRTSTGKTYHLEGCPSLTNAKTTYEVVPPDPRSYIDDPRLDPCSICRPPPISGSISTVSALRDASEEFATPKSSERTVDCPACEFVYDEIDRADDTDPISLDFYPATMDGRPNRYVLCPAWNGLDYQQGTVPDDYANLHEESVWRIDENGKPQSLDLEDLIVLVASTLAMRVDGKKDPRLDAQVGAIQGEVIGRANRIIRSRKVQTLLPFTPNEHTQATNAKRKALVAKIAAAL